MYMYLNLEEKVKKRKYVATLKRMPRGGKREGAGNKRNGGKNANVDEGGGAKNASSRGDEFLCSVCGTGYDFKTIQNLNKHEKTDSHKRKVASKFAAAEEAEKSGEDGGKKADVDKGGGGAKNASGDEFFCSVCGTGHDFKTINNLNRHEKTDSHEKQT